MQNEAQSKRNHIKPNTRQLTKTPCCWPFWLAAITKITKMNVMAPLLKIEIFEFELLCFDEFWSSYFKFEF